jgi:predicted membrane protein
MNTKLKPKITSHQVALIAIFAALYCVLALITPRLPTPAVAGIEIGIVAFIASVFGIILGPYLGGAAALLGSFVSWLMLGASVYGVPFIIAPMFNALIVGFIFYKKWKYAFITFTALIIAFLFVPPVTPLNGQSVLADLTVANWYIAAAVLFDKIISMFLILPIAFFGKKLSFAWGSIFFFILSFIGNQADNIWGTLIFSTPPVYAGIFGMDLPLVQGSLIVSPFIYPVIRLIQAFLATLIAVPLVRMLYASDWLWSKDNIFTNNSLPAKV